MYLVLYLTVGRVNKCYLLNKNIYSLQWKMNIFKSFGITYQKRSRSRPKKISSGSSSNFKSAPAPVKKPQLWPAPAPQHCLWPIWVHLAKNLTFIIYTMPAETCAEWLNFMLRGWPGGALRSTGFVPTETFSLTKKKILNTDTNSDRLFFTMTEI